ncbi:hypothetical protein DFH08DRAFT_953203 [Mycena albidolilacea]|uniref:Uncharacterized protein n=1 Tax=Mycena albidolilacea TaxID=1033008 RepID=A0AAD7AG75_9AGAR|nr:hypothetical protein DFH08DRAFT_953203 [Mycena albidolilacea]
MSRVVWRSDRRAQKCPERRAENYPEKRPKRPKRPKHPEHPDWAEGMHNSITTPPQALKLNFGEGSKAAPVSCRAKDVPPPPQPYAPYYPPPPGYPHGYPPYYPPLPPPPSASLPPVPVALDSQEDEDLTLLPKIGGWLLELAEKDKDGHNFLSFGPLLRAQGLMRVL